MLIGNYLQRLGCWRSVSYSDEALRCALKMSELDGSIHSHKKKKKKKKIHPAECSIGI